MDILAHYANTDSIREEAGLRGYISTVLSHFGFYFPYDIILDGSSIALKPSDMDGRVALSKIMCP